MTQERWGPIREGLIDARLSSIEARLLAAALEQEFPDPDAAQWDALTLRAFAAVADGTGNPDRESQ